MGKQSMTVQLLQTKQRWSLQLTYVYLIASTSINQLHIAKCTSHHRYELMCLYLKTKCRKKTPRTYMTIGDINIKLRSQREFHKPNDRSSSIYGTVTVLMKEDCLLTALLYLEEELPINLSFFKNCRKGKRRHSFLAIAN